jgi:hypothetical protein
LSFKVIVVWRETTAPLESMKKQMISVLGAFSKARLKIKTALWLTKGTSLEESKIPLAVI